MNLTRCLYGILTELKWEFNEIYMNCKCNSNCNRIQLEFKLNLHGIEMELELNLHEF